MKIAVVGVTGMVGNVILKVLAERNFPIKELIPVASEKSVGKNIQFNGKTYKVIGLKDAVRQKPDIALFSAGGDTSLEWAPQFAAVGTTVIDNSSAWRMDKSKKLIVPEINANIITKTDKIIANPNCSTIQMLMVLAPLHKKYGIKRVVVSTYQSITGTGVKAVEQMDNERNGKNGEHCDTFTDNGYTKEELKLVNETRKILDDDTIRLTATAVRVPVVGGHSESVNIEFENDFNLQDIKNLLKTAEGIVLQDDIKNNIYPMPINANNKDGVFVGRIRRDFSNPNSLNLWIVADNLRKGAATNAVQIAEYLLANTLLSINK
ncbi:MAG: aspartate-semialdehyde dehydrogenase [Bacteroidetes bacterium 4572_117]|nr:MAG: aspartate-semialdehyde dehydrogenase [Bacteroidetes bacterium 4572_117]